MGARLFQGGRVEVLALGAESDQPVEISLDRLLEEIKEAHRDWVNAQYHFEQASGHDQIDYAVFAIEAAQKRYEMLLRQAKRIGAVSPDWQKRGMQG
ncbi:YaaL family protein [Paenibacillus albicereus]|uniref:YaaL family protein n=1 Tax=Paenibacillus albicereus TaxID=2726185 RepID=A0A6H2GSF8_9BACL|nr:DUF2508 family protein [Paenibacillus albicereus]QJC50363.1 YaaL family protein [Paenibacillus albicereus]